MQYLRYYIHWVQVNIMIIFFFFWIFVFDPMVEEKSKLFSPLTEFNCTWYIGSQSLILHFTSMTPILAYDNYME